MYKCIYIINKIGIKTNNSLMTGGLTDTEKLFLCWFQVVKRAVVMSVLMAGIGGALTVLRILKKDMKLFWKKLEIWYIAPDQFKYLILVILKELGLWWELLHWATFNNFIFVMFLLGRICIIKMIESLNSICLFQQALILIFI